jgi:hypothetical protein
VIASRLRDAAHAHAFGQILSEQAVEVLVAAALPRVVWSCEVHLQRKALLEQRIVMELGTVVEGKGLELAAVLADCARRRARYGKLVAGGQLLTIAKPVLRSTRVSTQ